jgi:hypothetical protein
MSILGGVGYFYLFILIMILIISFTLLGLWFFRQLLTFVKTPRFSEPSYWTRLILFSFVAVVGFLFLMSLLFQRPDINAMNYMQH